MKWRSRSASASRVLIAVRSSGWRGWEFHYLSFIRRKSNVLQMKNHFNRSFDYSLANKTVSDQKQNIKVTDKKLTNY